VGAQVTNYVRTGDVVETDRERQITETETERLNSFTVGIFSIVFLERERPQPTLSLAGTVLYNYD
jgi:hypothetical protein